MNFLTPKSCYITKTILINLIVTQDGLVHISQLCDKFVKDPTEVVKLHQHVRVKVVEVDMRRHRISLSMKGLS